MHAARDHPVVKQSAEAHGAEGMSLEEPPAAATADRGELAMLQVPDADLIARVPQDSHPIEQSGDELEQRLGRIVRLTPVRMEPPAAPGVHPPRQQRGSPGAGGQADER